MKKALLIASVLFIAVISTACINNIAVQELNNKALAYMEKGDYETAMNRLQSSLELDSSLYETYYNLGIAATKAQKYDVAIEAFENGLKTNPNYANFYYSLAVAQAEYYEYLLESEDKDKDKNVKEDKDEEFKIDKDDLKNSSIENANKYLELNPDAKDKNDMIILIENLNKEIKDNQTKVLEL